MLNNLEIFNYENNNVRAFEKDGQAWFVAKDVCDILDVHTSQTRRLDDDEKGLRLIQTHGGDQEMTVVNEAGLYSLILGSRKKEAKKFKRWITHEVLPSIRKHGIYATENTLDKMINSPEFGIRLLTEIKAEREKNKALEHENAVHKQVIGELKPKADYTDKILKNKGLVTITQIAKDYSMSGNAMNNLLHDLGVQYKQSDQWLLYREYHDKGYTHSETINITRSDGRPDVKMNTKWTQKGRLFLYDLLKENWVLPVIEMEVAQ